MTEPEDFFHVWSIVGDRYVSTIHRRSSTILALSHYETVIFERNKQTGELGRMLHCRESYDIETARKKHWQITESLLKRGESC